MRILLTSLLLLTTPLAHAAEETGQTRYITDNFRADLRSIPKNNGRIMNYLRAGTRLIVLEQNEEGWSRIQTSRGEEGWLRSDYLVDQQVAKFRIAGVQQQVEQLTADNGKLKNDIQQKDTELKQLRAQIEQLSEQNKSADQKLTDLRKISANPIAINTQNQELLKRNSQLESDLEAQAALNDQLENDQRFSWFMYGAFAVCLGALLTVLIPMLKRKRRYSEWG